MRRPLEGIRVLDLSIWQQGTYATALLADLGADVIKIEERHSGDPGRYLWVIPQAGLSCYFEAHNRGKRSIALDLKHPDGRAAVLRLARDADAFLNNLRLSSVERLGLDYESLARVNPRLIYVHASGYGPLGPDADEGSFDFLAQARGGFASTNGEPDDPPLPAAVPIADQVGALHACIALLAGLSARNATGRGMKFDTSLLGSMVSLQAFDINAYLFSGGFQRPRFERGSPRPFWRLYRGGDEKWFIIGMLMDRAWPELTSVIGRTDLLTDERFDSYNKRVGQHAQDLIAILDAVFATAPAAHWVERLNAIGMFAQPVQGYAELSDDPQVLANGYVQRVERQGGEPVRMAGTGISMDGEPVTIRGLAPQHGEHTEEVLLEAGYSWDEITRLRDAGAIGPEGHRDGE